MMEKEGTKRKLGKEQERKEEKDDVKIRQRAGERNPCKENNKRVRTKCGW